MSSRFGSGLSRKPVNGHELLIAGMDQQKTTDILGRNTEQGDV